MMVLFMFLQFIMSISHKNKSFKYRLAKALDPALKKTLGLSKTNKLIVLIIFFSLVVTILETEPLFYLEHTWLFFSLDWIFTIIFIIEYGVRVWVSTENPHYKTRWHYIISFAALIDLAMVVLILLTDLGAKGFFLRVARLIRIFRIARLGRYSAAINHLKSAIYQRREELTLSMGIALLVLLGASVCLYAVEGKIQPDKFGSIPRAMWWAVITLTTVGYGDTYPITPLGKLFASITAFAGIGLIAMPAGILASSFSDVMQNSKKNR